jgi:hypothetical protein
VRFTPKIALGQLFDFLVLAMRFRLDRFVRLCERYIMYNHHAPRGTHAASANTTPTVSQIVRVS